MGIAKRTRKFAQEKSTSKTTGEPTIKKLIQRQKEEVRHIPQVPSQFFFQSNEALGPSYHIILDTNFFSQTLRFKTDIVTGLMDLLLAKCIPVVTDCTIAELEKLGPKYRLALLLAKDERFERLRCSHPGTYADDCIVSNVTRHRCYLVGTNDRELKQKLRKIPGVPLITVGKGRYYVERLPDVIG
ncbi:Fcf1-domain-containing protein [Colletotrichum zoysiae]|uniref:Fcf1-domain-containing protein n=1 Tax=Colletotrichum zoysiae TaxID=1216348 RepID=A0AAD9HFA1_9PEZI|nr:Fcf1-domain-containing protein [Colletotrichum zoysiae]